MASVVFKACSVRRIVTLRKTRATYYWQISKRNQQFWLFTLIQICLFVVDFLLRSLLAFLIQKFQYILVLTSSHFFVQRPEKWEKIWRNSLAGFFTYVFLIAFQWIKLRLKVMLRSVVKRYTQHHFVLEQNSSVNIIWQTAGSFYKEQTISIKTHYLFKYCLLFHFVHVCVYFYPIIIECVICCMPW